MLTLLKIRNLALVDELVWEPEPGFLSITGETGAGKSVIMGGLSLLLGERADKGRIRSGESQCSLEAAFRLTDATAINEISLQRRFTSEQASSSKSIALSGNFRSVT